MFKNQIAQLGGKRTGLKRVPFGEKRRASEQAESKYAVAFEQLMQVHKLDFWHCTVAQRSQPGFPDYNVFGDGWHAWVELKARSRLTGKMGKMSAGQYRYQASVEKSGGEWWTFYLPDDWRLVETWLHHHTGIEVWGYGQALSDEQWKEKA